MIEQGFIDLAELVQDISKVVLKGAFIIKEISQNLESIYYKDDQYDPVTEADYLVQLAITEYLAKKYTGLRIVAEENMETYERICKKVLQKENITNSSKINPNYIMEDFPIKKQSVYVQLSKLCLWIDPLDCTRGFVSNRKQNVTTLVGITEDNKPIAGVICQPFMLKSQNKCQFNPRLFIGSEYFNKQNQKKFCYEYNLFEKSWKKWQQFHLDNNSSTQRRVAISGRRNPLRQRSLMQKVNMQRHQIGGAGSKFIKLIKKQVGTLMFIDSRTSKWDSCAGQAIIKAMGGFSIKPNLEQIVYNPDEQYINNEGFIISLSNNVFKEIKQHIETKAFQNLIVQAILPIC